MQKYEVKQCIPCPKVVRKRQEPQSKTKRGEGMAVFLLPGLGHPVLLGSLVSYVNKWKLFVLFGGHTHLCSGITPG